MSSVEWSEALIEALSRAAALPRDLPVAWPPTSVPRLDREALAEELRRTQCLPRGPELAIVALAEVGDAAEPALRAELAALVRDELAELSDWPGSVGAALKGRMLDGLRVADGARALQVDWSVPYLCNSEGHMHVAMRWSAGDVELRARGVVRMPSYIANRAPGRAGLARTGRGGAALGARRSAPGLSRDDRRRAAAGADPRDRRRTSRVAAHPRDRAARRRR
ncbi:hypothetical protein [Nannocystis pusilla]|uniref:hypothetical protein n=1 Tax=Nannocystis pusilla TaxID=889268 RepID=UPI003DA3C418